MAAKPQGGLRGKRSGGSSNTLPLQSPPPNVPLSARRRRAVLRLRARFLYGRAGNFKYRGCAGWLVRGRSWASFVLALSVFSCGGFLFLSCWFSAFCVCFFFVFFCFVLFFFVALSHVWCWFPRFLPVSLRGCGGSVFRLVGCVRLVRFLRVPCPRVGRDLPRGSRCRGLPSVCLLAVWAPGVLLVCGVVGGLRLRGIPRGVGRFGRCSRFGRSAFFVLLVFFNICRARLWHPPRHRGKFAALDGGFLAVEMN